VIARRAFLAAVAAAPALRAEAQTPLKIGWLSISEHPLVADFRDRMRQLGYVEGANLVIEYRYAEGNAARLPALVEELVKAGVSVLVVSGSAATDAAVAGAKGVPIVFVTSDPTSIGQIASFARPGGVATGISTMSELISSKRLGLLREAVPELARLAMLNDGSSGGARQTEQLTASAQKLGIEARAFACTDPNGFARVFAEIAADRWQGAIAVSSPLFAAHARTIADLTLKHRIPASFDTPAFVWAGALMSYSADLQAAFRRQAELVQRLARGAKLADMPVEQASKFIFAFNQATAKAWGITLSLPVMASVDELVE
jgi:putative ABC transport system substrate-binding protein